MMRTTVYIDDDLAIAIEELRKREGMSFQSALNLVIRLGIQAKSGPPDRKKYRTPTMAIGLKSGIDPTLFNALVDDFETDALIGNRD